jgi:hypothetical protein
MCLPYYVSAHLCISPQTLEHAFGVFHTKKNAFAFLQRHLTIPSVIELVEMNN